MMASSVAAWSLVAALALAPAWLLLVHVAVMGAARLVGRPLGPQLGAVLAVLLSDAVLLAVALAWGGEIWTTATPLDLAAGIAWSLASLTAMGFFYFQLVNVALTSIHMHVLLQVFWAGGLDRGALEALYGSGRMVAQRGDRLEKLGQVERSGGRVRLRSHLLIVLSLPIYLWRRFLGVGP